eukprot:7137402-Prymnesium_polylepis.1
MICSTHSALTQQKAALLQSPRLQSPSPGVPRWCTELGTCSEFGGPQYRTPTPLAVSSTRPRNEHAVL